MGFLCWVSSHLVSTSEHPRSFPNIQARLTQESRYPSSKTGGFNVKTVSSAYVLESNRGCCSPVDVAPRRDNFNIGWLVRGSAGCGQPTGTNIDVPRSQFEIVHWLFVGFQVCLSCACLAVLRRSWTSSTGININIDIMSTTLDLEWKINIDTGSSCGSEDGEYSRVWPT